MPYTVNSKKYGKVRIKDTTNIARLSKAPRHGFPMVGYPNAYDWNVRERFVYEHQIKTNRAALAEMAKYGGRVTEEYREIMAPSEMLESL